MAVKILNAQKSKDRDGFYYRIAIDGVIFEKYAQTPEEAVEWAESHRLKSLGGENK